MSRAIKVLFLTQTSQAGASARYRVYQYISFIKKEGIEFDIAPAVPDGMPVSVCSSRICFYGSQILRRFRDIVKVKKYDVIFLQRDIIIHFYPFLERIIALLNNNIIFDFDDAIYLFPSHKKPGFFSKLLWDKRKIERIIKLSKYIIAGNSFLKRYAESFTKNVTVIPTSVDLALYTTRQIPRDLSDKVTKIGWIGSQGSFGYLEDIFPVFNELAEKYRIELKVVGAKGPSLGKVRTDYADWSLDTEIKNISDFDIGVMPLRDDEWSRGKSATKLLQYMAAGIPAVASKVGVNAEIIKDGQNGFLIEEGKCWIEKISKLIEDRQLRQAMADNARADVEKLYSIQANARKFIKVIEKVARGNLD